MFYKSELYEFDRMRQTDNCYKIIYKLINFGDTYFFAQEVSTGCIFPVYAYDDVGAKGMYFVSCSYVRDGKYYVYLPLIRKKNEQFKIAIGTDSEGFECVTPNEINKYIFSKKIDFNWKKKLEQMEGINKYFCDLSEIKEAISKLNVES